MQARDSESAAIRLWLLSAFRLKLILRNSCFASRGVPLRILRSRASSVLPLVLLPNLKGKNTSSRRPRWPSQMSASSERVKLARRIAKNEDSKEHWTACIQGFVCRQLFLPSDPIATTLFPLSNPHSQSHVAQWLLLPLTQLRTIQTCPFSRSTAQSLSCRWTSTPDDAHQMHLMPPARPASARSH